MDYVGRSGVNGIWAAAERAAVQVGDAVAALRNPAAIAKDAENAQRHADLFAQEELHRRLTSNYPGVPIISEEDESHAEERPSEYWLIDPIDGTASWAGGFPGFVTQAAFIRAGVVKFGVIHAPVLHRTWAATQGVGAFCNGQKLPPRKSVHNPLVVIDNYPRPRGFCLDLVKWLGNAEYQESGSLGLKAALVAIGQADVFVKRVVVRDWDMAPAMAVCAETGAFLTQVDGSAFPLSGSYEKRDGVIVAANEQLARRVADWIHGR